MYRAALQKLHNNNPVTRGLYMEPCNLCINSEEGNGCDTHRGIPLIRLKGNVCADPKFSAAILNSNEYIKRNYIIRATVAFLPFQLRAMRLYLIGCNKIPQLMIWAVLLFAVNQGLRIEEVLTLTYESFLLLLLMLLIMILLY